MSRNTVYFDIFKTDTHFEYHTSAELDDVFKRRSMNRRIAKGSPVAADKILEWIDDAMFYDCVRIHSQVSAGGDA